MVLWLIPILYVGFMKKDLNFLGNYLTNLHRCACLFTERVGVWSNYYFQARLEGSDEWIEVPHEHVSTLQPFGHRTRMTAMIGQTSAAMHIRQGMAEFIKKRREWLYPDDPKVEAVRFIRVTYRSGSEIATPAGHWKIPPLEEIAPNRRRALTTHFFDGREAIDHVQRPRTTASDRDS
jgi:hypothetical protein